MTVSRERFKAEVSAVKCRGGKKHMGNWLYFRKPWASPRLKGRAGQGSSLAEIKLQRLDVEGHGSQQQQITLEAHSPKMAKSPGEKTHIWSELNLYTEIKFSHSDH